MDKSVVLLINSLQGGGAERSVLTLGQGFFELGFEVHIICFTDAVEYDLNQNFHYHTVLYRPYRFYPTRNLRYKMLAREVDTYIQTKIPDCKIILSNLVTADRVLRNIDFPKAAHVIRNTFSVEYESALTRKKHRTLKSFGDVYSKHPCICISQGVESDFNHVFNKVNTRTIYNAFDRTEIETMADEFLPEHSDYLVHVGKFKYQKAHDILLKSYAKSNQKLPLLLIGKGKLLEPMKQLANELGISEKVYFLGFHKNPYPYIKHAKGMVLSSHFEGFGRVIVESLALKTPVISTDCPSGPRELLPSSSLVLEADIDALAKKMSELMLNPDDFLIPFDEKFLPKNIAQQYLDFFNR